METGRWTVIVPIIVWVFMIVGAFAAWGQTECQETPSAPYVIYNNGTIHWRVPQGTLYNGGKAYCSVIVTHPADQRVVGLDYQVVEPCQLQTSQFPELKGPNVLEIRCSNLANVPGPSLTVPVKFGDTAGVEKRWEYEVTGCSCAEGFPVKAPSGHILCAY